MCIKYRVRRSIYHVTIYLIPNQNAFWSSHCIKLENLNKKKTDNL